MYAAATAGTAAAAAAVAAVAAADRRPDDYVDNILFYEWVCEIESVHACIIISCCKMIRSLLLKQTAIKYFKLSTNYS